MKNLFLLIMLSACAVLNVSCQDGSGVPFDMQYLGMKKPGKIAELFAGGIVTYPYMNHSSVTISRDMDEIYWSKWYDDEGREEIVFSRFQNGSWSEPCKAPFSGVYSDDVPFFAPDGQRLYFLSRRPLTGKDYSGYETIWYVERFEGSKWSEPVPLPDIINSKQIHWQFSVAAGGSIYYSSDKGIMVAEYSDGEYQDPVPLTSICGPGYNGGLPYIAPDESYIIFAADLDDSIGRNDLYIGYRLKDGTWSKPVNLGPGMNTPKDELCPQVSPDKRWIFFIRHDEKYNVYWAAMKFPSPGL